VENELLHYLQNQLSTIFSLPVNIMHNMAIPQESLDINRNQYYSTMILREILKDTPAEAIKILGIVEQDLCTPVLTFVFGEALLNGKAALVSAARLRQEFHRMEANEALFMERLLKECMHELGHTFGLVHCSTAKCVMRFSPTVFDVDRKDQAFCRGCRQMLTAKIKTSRGIG
jgi:archaemetzincin